MSDNYRRPTHEEEYLRVHRDRAFEELEKRIGATTINYEDLADIDEINYQSMKDKRVWFRKTFDYMADDITIRKAWEAK